MSHTSGPWIADQGGVCDEQGNDIAVCGELAQWSGDCFHPFKNAEANARLIAAAPDLLEALTNLLADCGETMADGYVENSIHSTEVEAARAAIARATVASV